MIEGHGDDVFRYDGKVRVNFSTNIHQSVDHSGLMSHLARLFHLRLRCILKDCAIL